MSISETVIIKGRKLLIAHKDIRVKGIVQGVGFRPFIFTLAEDYSLAGTVRNDTEGVFIEAEGDEESLVSFIRDITEKAPPLAHILQVEVYEGTVEHFSRFTIASSEITGERHAFYSPDVAVCEECLKEFNNPQERRYHYPFITCTHCGPRLSIVHDIPYDRDKTAMKEFPLCEACRKEYDSPGDRRFHTQPLACPVCGPHLTLMDTSGAVISEDTEEVAAEAVRLLKEGKIIAVKGAGGYLLAADAENDGAVKELRERKRRPFKPFALMVSSINRLREIARVSETEEKLLLSKERPILLLDAIKSNVSESTAPGLSQVGIMLPYLPFQYHLFSFDPEMILIMTSGNMADEPIIYRDAAALKNFAPIADYIISYNREIVSQNDDSVLQVFDDEALFIRRSRGYVPLPFASAATGKRILAVGGDLKNAFALARKDFVIMSQYLGDMADPATQEAFRTTVNHYIKIFDAMPDLIAADAHPGYMTTAFAEELSKGSIEVIHVQHHYAHALSVIEDRKIEGPVIGIIFDGTGYGSDGKLWGSEILLADRNSFSRRGHFSYFKLPGGEESIKNVWKIGLSLLHGAYGDNFPVFEKTAEAAMLIEIMKKGLNSPETCSIGRLFDGISSLLGIRRRISTEAEAAILLEEAAIGGRDLRRGFTVPVVSGEEMIVPVNEITRFIVDLMLRGEGIRDIAMTFHLIVADAAVVMAGKLRDASGANRVVLSGGVFHNRILLATIKRSLEEGGFGVFLPHGVPVNDGAIALGQVVAAKGLSCL